jgi:hypothetical protein
MQRKAAIELSVGTIVVLVLSMSMLILGLVLVKNIFTGSIYNVQSLNDKVKNEITKLFAEDETRKSVIFLAENKADIKQGQDWGIAFSFRNLQTGTTASDTYSYVVKAGDISTECRGLSKAAAENWIKARRTESGIKVAPGDSYTAIIRFQVPSDAPLCIVPYSIVINKGADVYTTETFDIVVKP